MRIWTGHTVYCNGVFDGVLRYNRQKTGKLAVVKLPTHVRTLLSNVPLDEDNSKEQPFLHKNASRKSSIRNWRDAFVNLCKQAGITEIKTKFRIRNPHLHMLRDTCAVYFLKHGMSLMGVARILGDTVQMVEKHYLPFVKELEEAHIEENEAILAAAGAD